MTNVTYSDSRVSVEDHRVDVAPCVGVLTQALNGVPLEVQVAALRYLHDRLLALAQLEAVPPTVVVRREVQGPALKAPREDAVQVAEAAPAEAIEVPEVSAEEPAAQEIGEELQSFTSAHEILMNWLIRVGIPSTKGPFLAKDLHVKAPPTACPARKKDGKVAKKGCMGNFGNCEIRMALRLLAGQPEFPLRATGKRKRGPWGPEYVFDGWEQSP